MLLRFSLIDYTFNAAGDTTVIDEPNGWQNIAIKVKRDKKTHGIFFDVTANSLEFVGDGYSVIKDAYDDSGVFANTKIIVEINCSENYRTLYEGRLRYEAIDFLFSDYCMAKVPIEQVGCLQTFINRQETEVDINATETLDGTAVSAYSGLGEWINLPPKGLPITVEVQPGFAEPIYTIVESQVLTWGFYRDMIIRPEFNILRNEFETLEIDDTIAIFGSPISFAPLNVGHGHPLRFTDDLSDCYVNSYLRVFASIDVDVSVLVRSAAGNIPFTCYARVYHTNSIGTPQASFTIDSHTDTLPAGIGGVVTFNLTGNQNYTFTGVQVGDRFEYILYFAAQAGTEGTFDTEVTMNYDTANSIFRASLIEECDESPCKVSFINEVLSRNAELITDGCLRVYSEYFGRTDSQPYAHASDGCGGLECIANGLQIRRATRTDGSDPKLFVNFKDLYDGLNAIHNIGMGIEEDTQGRDYMLRIEPVVYWYPYSIMHTVDLPMEVKISYDESRSYQTVQIGYDKWESEYSGGLDEFLTKREYRTELTTVDNKLDQVSKLIASGYAIEVTRRQGQTTEDFTYDNDIFIICLERGGYTGFEVEIVPLTAVDVLSTTNIYNVRISPVRNLIRWFKTIASSWTKVFDSANKLLIFNSGEGNYIADLTNTAPDSCWVGDAIVENQDISKNTEIDTTPLWEAETIEFEYPLSWDDFLTIKADPKGLVQVNLTNSTIFGWIEEINYKPNDGIAVWKLIKAYDAADILCDDYLAADYNNSDYCTN